MQSARDQVLHSLNDLSVGSPRPPSPHTHTSCTVYERCKVVQYFMNCSVSFSVRAEIFLCTQGNVQDSVDPVGSTACCARQSRSFRYLLFANGPRNFLTNLWLKSPFHEFLFVGECRMHHLSISTCAHSRVAEFKIIARRESYSMTYCLLQTEGR